MIEKLKGLKKKLNKENMIVLTLLGALLMVIALPVKKDGGQAKTGQSDTGSGTMETETPSTLTSSDYARELEERLAVLLASMEGVGEAKVMVTMKASEEQVVEKDSPVDQGTTLETDSEGGNRSVSSTKREETTIYVTDAKGNKIPYVKQTLVPSVEGVTVVAKGGGDATVQKNITDVLQALFGIEANKVKVVKMK